MKLIKCFQWVVCRNVQSSLPCKCIVFEGGFYTYLCFFGRDIKEISNIKCLAAVVTENTYLLSFVALFLIMFRAVFFIQIFFSYILVSLKKDLTVNTMEYLK